MSKLLRLIFIFSISVFSAASQITYPVNGTTDPRHVTYAFTNAQLHVDYQTIIDSATLLIKDGIILEAGKDITVSKDMVVYNLKGKHIYPSLIDLFTDYGMPEINSTVPKDNPPQFLSATKGAYDWNQSIKAETDAYRNFSVDAKKAEEFRKLGFGTVLSHSKDGIMRGSATLVLLGDGKENKLVITDRAAAVSSFDKGSSPQDYPGSLMGAIALLRQSYYDASWYKNGGYHKEFNISLDAINKLLSLPQLFDAGEKQNELRVHRLGEEFGINYIIKGGGDEYERLDEIAAKGNALIVPINFPEAIDVSDPYDATLITLRQMKEWEMAPTNPYLLSTKNIRFALTTADLKNKNDFWKNLRKAMDNGLSEEDALKALTYTPAQLIKAEDKIGALRKGMLANFIISSRKIADKENIIFENWINGTRYKLLESETGDIRGNYSLRINNAAPLRLKVGGEMFSPDATIFEDTASVKASLSRQGFAVSIQFELKNKDRKGVYRLAGTSDSATKNWNGNVLMSNGEWGKFTATFDSVFKPVIKADTSVKPKPTNGVVFYPNMAFGWTEQPQAKTFVIRHATVWTNETEGILVDADVYFSNGKIKQVGKGLTVPSGVEEIDGTNKHLTSGIIDEHSHIAVSGSVNEPTQASSAEVRIGDVVDADDIQIYRQLAGGVTVSHLLHGSANPIGGQTQLIKLRWGLSGEKLKFENWNGFIKFALGENVKQSNWGDRQSSRFPQTRMGVEQVYKDYFTRAKEYEATLKSWNTSDTKSRAGKIAPRKNIELDALVEILNHKRFITCHSYVQSEINMLMHVADSFGFTVNTFTHILEGFKVADKMKAHGANASTFSDWWAYKFEVYEAIPYNGAIMQKMGLNVGFNSDDPEMARRLNQEAAKAVKYGGVSEEDAWKFVTLNPAKMLHIDDRVGSIKVGKDADLVLWNENPLSIYAKPLKTFVDGVNYFDVDRDLQMRQQIREEKARLIQKMTEAKSKGEPVQKAGMKATEIKRCEESDFYLFNSTVTE